MPTKPTGRPRGRPPGSKNRPKTVEAFVLAAIAEPPKPKPKKRGWPAGPWAKMNAEERSAFSAQLRAKRGPLTGPMPGKPSAFTNKQWAEVQKAAKLDAKRIIERMKQSDQFPDDPRAAEALEKAVVTLRSSTAPKDIAALGRLILDFTKARPAQKIETTIRTHEDFLDELAGDNG